MKTSLKQMSFQNAKLEEYVAPYHSRQIEKITYAKKRC
jgi:hypothetical protein